MTSRVGTPDTQADIDVRTCLDCKPPRSFVMMAGAGSGKTTSLIKALAHLAETRGPTLRSAGQQIACITYTEVAVAEILADVGASPLFHISTIHSFLWTVIRPFKIDIAAWVMARVEGKIAEKREHYKKPRIQARTKARLEREIVELENSLVAIGRVETFTYGTGSNYIEGILGHEDILKLTPACVAQHPLLRQLIASSFPFIFVDESQDTNIHVIESLRQISREQRQICVGFFGDPVQKIYSTGTGRIQLLDGWADITKPENFRCPTSVLSVINAVRQPMDGLEQTRGRTKLIDGVEKSVVGTANLFVLPADAERTARLAAVRTWLAAKTDDDLWLSDLRKSDVRLLVLVHRMAATRLGFPNLYAALNDRAPQSLKEGLKDGTCWPLRPFIQYILPMMTAARLDDHFSVMSIVRANSPRLEAGRLAGLVVSEVLASLRQAVDALIALMAEGSEACVSEVIRHILNTELLRLDDRFAQHILAEPADDGHSGFANVQAFLACGVAELWSYRRYIDEESPFATHHGVKGAQFERVLVVIDDEEADYSLYSYGKYFGFSPLSDQDQENIAASEESVLDRTARLFYVCCSRAVKDLAVVVFAQDVEAARAAITGKKLFPAAAIHGVSAL